MAYNTVPIKKDSEGKPIPQYFNEVLNTFEPLQGEGGASKVSLKENIEELVYNALKKDDLRGLSSTTKPTTGINIGCTFFEIDTAKVFMWDGSAWRGI